MFTLANFPHQTQVKNPLCIIYSLCHFQWQSAWPREIQDEAVETAWEEAGLRARACTKPSAGTRRQAACQRMWWPRNVKADKQAGSEMPSASGRGKLGVVLSFVDFQHIFKFWKFWPGAFLKRVHVQGWENIHFPYRRTGKEGFQPQLTHSQLSTSSAQLPRCSARSLLSPGNCFWTDLFTARHRLLPGSRRRCAHIPAHTWSFSGAGLKSHFLSLIAGNCIPLLLTLTYLHVWLMQRTEWKEMHSDGKLPKFKAPLVKQLKKGTEIQLVLPNLGTPAGLWGPGKGQGHHTGGRTSLPTNGRNEETLMRLRQDGNS